MCSANCWMEAAHDSISLNAFVECVCVGLCESGYAKDKVEIASHRCVLVFPLHTQKNENIHRLIRITRRDARIYAGPLGDIFILNVYKSVIIEYFDSIVLRVLALC